MKRFVSAAISTVVCPLVLEYIKCPDSIVACLAIWTAASVADALLRMCDRLLDPHPALFRFIAPDLGRRSQGMQAPRRNDRLPL